MAQSRPCLYYQSGNCRKGVQCSFAHVLATPTTPAAAPRLPCRFWSLGTCMKGDQCSFSHGPLMASSGAPSVGTSPGRGTPAAAFNRSTGPTPHVAAAFGPCKFYARGSCQAGNSCHFSHVGPVTATTLSSPPRANVQLATSPTVTFNQTSPFLRSPCKFFLQGRCTAQQCPFPHTGSPTSPGPVTVAREPIAASSPKVQVPSNPNQPHRIVSSVHLEENQAPIVHPPVAAAKPPPVQVVGDHLSQPAEEWRVVTGTNVRVLYGAGAAIEEVMTAFDSTRILLSGLPLHLNELEILPKVETFGVVCDVTMLPTVLGGRRSATIEFRNCSSARNAAVGLNGAPFEGASIGAPVTAAVVPRAGERGSASLKSNTLRLQWHAPSRLAYAHYDGIGRAKQQAERLNGTSFDGRVVSATFQRPKTFRGSNFSVVLGNLPPSATAEHVRRFTRSDDVDMGRPSYDDDTGTNTLYAELERFGTVESFERQPPKQGATKFKALLRFADATAAENAAHALHKKPQEYLGRSPLWVERVFSVKYAVPRAQFVALRGDLDRLAAIEETVAKLRFYDTDESADRITVRVYSSEPKSLGKLKAMVERVLQGEPWTNDRNEVVWDECFSETTGAILLDEANTQPLRHARCDHQRRIVFLYGEPEERALLKRSLETGLESIRSNRQSVPLTGLMVRFAMAGGIRRVQERFGADSVSLNVASRVLQVKGQDIDLSIVRQLLKSEIEVRSEAPGDEMCPVCFCEPTAPKTLACGHAYCTSCIGEYLASAAESDRFPVACLGGDGSCTSAIPLETLSKLLSPELEARLLRSAFLAHVRSNQNTLRFCPTADCPEVYRVGEEGMTHRCPSCLNAICPACHVEYHEGNDCRSYRDLKSGGEEAFRRWQQERGVKACPKCRAYIEKISGCNHMTCASCKTHICWTCMGVFPQASIYDHMNRAHGGISI